jgi:anti-sigma-K factor RskA
MTALDEVTGDDALAAEYVLGVLPEDERQGVAERIAKDRSFAQLVDQWEARLGPLGESYAEASPPATVKAALDRRLFGAEGKQARAGFWQSLTVWRTIAAALAALLLLISVPVLRSTFLQEDQARLVALLAAEGSPVSYLAVYEPKTASVALSRVGAAQQGDRDFELWVINKDAAPVSMGVIPPGETTRVELSDALRLQVQAGANLAISSEPKGGSPTGQPTGPVVAVGELRNI